MEQAGAFAEVLEQLERRGGITTYKALLEASGCHNLGTALLLAEDVGEYQLTAECYSPEDYAQGVLEKADFGVNIRPFVSCWRLGQALMKQHNITDTSYGLLSRKDGGPLLSQADRPGISMEMR